MDLKLFFSTSLVGVGVRIFGLALNFSAFFVLLRILDKPAFGKFAVLWSLAQLVAALSRGGLERQYIREVGEFASGRLFPGEAELLTDISTLFLLFWAVASTGAGTVGLFVYGFSMWEVSGIALIGLILGQVALLSSQLRVRSHVLAAQIVDGLLLPTLMLVAFIGTFFAARARLLSGETSTVFFVQVITVASYAAVVWLYGRRVSRLRPALSFGARSRLVSLQLYVVLSFAVVSTINIAMNQTAFLVGGRVLTLSDLADFRVAIQFSSLVMLPLPIINLVAAPHLANLRRAGTDPDKKREAFMAILQTSLAISLPIFAGVTLLAPRLVEFYGGDDYADAVILVRILAAGALVNVLTGPVGLMLLTFDDERLYAGVGVVSLVINIALLLILSQIYGAKGAAAAVASTVALMNLTLFYIVMKRHVKR